MTDETYTDMVQRMDDEEVRRQHEHADLAADLAAALARVDELEATNKLYGQALVTNPRRSDDIAEIQRLTAERDRLTKENEALRAEVQRLRSDRAGLCDMLWNDGLKAITALADELDVEAGYWRNIRRDALRDAARRLRGLLVDGNQKEAQR
jgi:chromosome segregation ATPase